MRKPSVRTVQIGNFRLRVYSISWLAALTDRSLDTVRRWEARSASPALDDGP